MFDAQDFDEDGPPAFKGNPGQQQQYQPPMPPAAPVAVASATTSASAGEFPLTPPAWQPDADAPNCNLCHVPFDFLVRRHHCRACGQVFCDTCSDHKAMVPLAWQIREPQRTCVSCFRKLQPLQTQLIEANSNAVRANDHYSEEGAIRYFNRPVNFTLGGEIRKASYTIQNLIAGVEAIIEDNKYKAKLLRDSNALLFITTCKLAFIGGLRFGTGLIVVRLPDSTVGWSAPCAIGTIGLTFGAVVGAEVTDFVVPIKASDALDHFKQSAGHMTFSGEAGFAFGPVGRTATAEAMVGGAGVNSALSISNSKGIYGGVTIDGAHVHVRGDVNRKYYGYEPDVEDIFSGRVPPPTLNGKPLYDKLREYEQVLQALPGDDGLPAAWQPSNGFGHPGSPQNSTASGPPSSYTSFADQARDSQPTSPMQDHSEGFMV